jgi:hypothetical protein
MAAVIRRTPWLAIIENEMASVLNPIRIVLMTVAGQMNRSQRHIIDYSLEEGRVLREQLGERRVSLDGNLRCRLTAGAKELGRRHLAEVATIVTPAALLAWHRKVIARKCDGIPGRGPGRPCGAGEIVVSNPSQSGNSFLRVSGGGQIKPDALVEQHEHKCDLGLLIGEALAVASSDACERAVGLHFAKVIAELGEGLGCDGRAEGGGRGLVDDGASAARVVL